MVPSAQFRIYRSAAVGDNQGGGISAMTLPGTWIRGVVVDNPSGSWLKLDGVGLAFQPYIAPYTLAWSVSLLPPVAEISAAYVTGPTGQEASSAGAPAVIYLFENAVPTSPGSVFVTPTPQSILVEQQLVARPVVVNVNPWLSLPSPSNRFRVLYLSARHNSDAALNLTLTDSTTGTFFGTLGVPPEAGFADIAYPGGLDLAPGSNINLAYASVWGAVPFDLEFQYLVV